MRHFARVLAVIEERLERPSNLEIAILALITLFVWVQAWILSPKLVVLAGTAFLLAVLWQNRAKVALELQSAGSEFLQPLTWLLAGITALTFSFLLLGLVFGVKGLLFGLASAIGGSLYFLNQPSVKERLAQYRQEVKASLVVWEKHPLLGLLLRYRRPLFLLVLAAATAKFAVDHQPWGIFVVSALWGGWAFLTSLRTKPVKDADVLVHNGKRLITQPTLGFFLIPLQDHLRACVWLPGWLLLWVILALSGFPDLAMNILNFPLVRLNLAGASFPLAPSLLVTFAVLLPWGWWSLFVWPRWWYHVNPYGNVIAHFPVGCFTNTVSMASANLDKLVAANGEVDNYPFGIVIWWKWDPGFAYGTGGGEKFQARFIPEWFRSAVEKLQWERRSD